MDQHLQRWLDYYSARYSRIRFIFWSDFISQWKKSNKNRLNAGVSRKLYDDWAQENSNHVNLFDFVKNSGSSLKELLQKDSIHKNALGRQRFLEILISNARSYNAASLD